MLAFKETNIWKFEIKIENKWIKTLYQTSLLSSYVAITLVYLKTSLNIEID